MNEETNSGPLWIYPPESPDWKKSIIEEFHIHPITAQILISRNFTTIGAIHQHLYAKLPALLPPELFPDMDKAIARIIAAMENKEKLLIYGDNDVDGITATTLLVDFFQNLGLEVFYYVPNRNSLERSIIIDALDYALANYCSLLITVDCGITAAKEIEQAGKKNVDVIITDHHEPTSKMPHCIATLNPKLFGNSYPNRELTGVGVAFKLAHAVLNYLIENGKIKSDQIDLKSYLDLVALGTISDMGALLGENRILVRYGLIEMNNTKRIGLKKLIEVCGLLKEELSPMDVASKIAPRINSLGRIADPKMGVELLLIKGEEEAMTLAEELDLYNIERQQIERQVSEEVEVFLETHPQIVERKAIVLYSPNWHPGVIAIISAKISKQYNRPTLIIAIDKGIGKGSMRTIPEYPLLPVLKENRDLLTNFGGHDYAAGLTIKESNISELKKRFINHAENHLKQQDILSKLYLDAHIEFKDLTFDFMESLKLLQPYGNENPPPLLYSEVIQTWPAKIVGKSHLKMFFSQGSRRLEGIGFGMASRKDELRGKNLELEIAFTPHINIFLKKSSIQLQIKEFKVK